MIPPSPNFHTTEHPRPYFGLILISLLPLGCQALGLPLPSFHEEPIEPASSRKMLFTSSSQDLSHLGLLGKEAEKLLMHCQSTDECAAAHFTRGLSFLPEHTELALHHFNIVAASPGEDPLAQSSRTWIWILEATNPSNIRTETNTVLTQGLLHAVLTKDLNLARQHLAQHSNGKDNNRTHNNTNIEAKFKSLTEQVQGLAHEVASLHNQSSTIQGLQKEIEARDKKVEELTLQLDALRRIDQELKEKSTPTRLSETLIPPKDDRGSTP